MLGTVLYGAGDVRCEDVPEPKIIHPTDAIIRLSATCICGSDLWPFRGLNDVTIDDRPGALSGNWQIRDRRTGANQLSRSRRGRAGYPHPRFGPRRVTGREQYG